MGRMEINLAVKGYFYLEFIESNMLIH